MRSRRVPLGVALALTLVAVLGVTATASTRSTPRVWASVSSAEIHPGVQTITNGGQCTANFVFTQGSVTYLGQAAHCASTGSSTETDGCTTPTLPVGTPVDVGSYRGTIAYSSWATMQAVKEKDPSTCAYNDLALVALPPAAVARTNPSIPFWGGPTGLGGGTTAGEKVYSFGNSELRLGVSQLGPKQGLSLGDSAGGWTTNVYTMTPGIPGDSGSGFLDATGHAFGVLSTVELAPLAGSNGVGNLAKEIRYAQTHGLSGLALVPGTEPFNPNALG